MTTSSNESSPSLSALVAYLFSQRETILNKWRTVCQNDPTLGMGFSLSREEFNNLLPLILDSLEQRLLSQPQAVDTAITAQAHGLHRWQKSITLLATMREIAHLSQILYEEVKRYQILFPQTDAQVLLGAQQQIAQVMQETMEGSVLKFDELQRLEAAQRAKTLQQALAEMTDLSQERANLLRTSAHDLRGGLGIANGAAYMLKLAGLSDEKREQYLAMLNRNLANVEVMLTGLMDLSRLEAGGESLQLEHIDVAPLLQNMADSRQGLAHERELILRADGPDSLLVDTDPIKLQRIIQNLLQNALSYTLTGFVSISWSLENDSHWIVSVQDSGPGLPPTLAGIFGDQLRPTVEPTSVLAADAGEPVAVLPVDVPAIPDEAALNQVAPRPGHGEGIGLQIVKRLCELFGANLEVENIAGRGLLFRIRFPLRYNDKMELHVARPA